MTIRRRRALRPIYTLLLLLFFALLSSEKDSKSRCGLVAGWPLLQPSEYYYSPPSFFNFNYREYIILCISKYIVCQSSICVCEPVVYTAGRAYLYSYLFIVVIYIKYWRYSRRRIVVGECIYAESIIIYL